MTAPSERLPIQTFYLNHSEEVIQNAIRKELDRGGQVFFVHNRVETIDAMGNFISGLVPEAKVKVAHGRQKEKELEKNIIDFLDGKFNVLVCTTIIESGVDMPTVNTIIVNKADRFGLAQLYQLRGRVGRSNIQSYAYFFVDSKSTVTAEARQRLDILTSHNELGMGFKIAQYDLELRGAGNILGSNQSGRINEIGYELYMNLLKEEVEKLKGNSDFKSIYSEAEVSLKMDAKIPESYIESESVRLKLYRDLFKISKEDELYSMEASISDQYGKLPKRFKKLFLIAKIKVLASNANVKQINKKGHVELIFNSLSELLIESILKIVEGDTSLSLSSDFKLKLNVKDINDDMIVLDKIIKILMNILEGSRNAS